MPLFWDRTIINSYRKFVDEKVRHIVIRVRLNHGLNPVCTLSKKKKQISDYMCRKRGDEAILPHVLNVFKETFAFHLFLFLPIGDKKKTESKNEMRFIDRCSLGR